MLRSQPLSLWISLVAALVSILSFIATYTNMKRNRHLDTLERRTQLLLKLIDVESRIVIGKLILDRSRGLLRRCESHPIPRAVSAMRQADQIELRRAGESFAAALTNLEDLSKMQVDLENQIMEIEQIVKGLRERCDGFDESTNPKEIEKVIPRAHEMQSKMESFSTMITSACERPLENSLRVLDDVGAQLRSLGILITVQPEPEDGSPDVPRS
jgi:predicted RNase H-like nuclease (RuvC/YqgF family)